MFLSLHVSFCLQRNRLQSGNRRRNKLPEIHWSLNRRQRPGAGDSEEWGSHMTLMSRLVVVVVTTAVWLVDPLSPSLQIAVLRGENAVAKTLQSAVETLERDKAQLQSRVRSLEQRLMGTQASEGEDIEAPPSGEGTMIRALKLFQSSFILSTCFLIPSCRRCSSGAAEGREGVRGGTSKIVRTLPTYASSDPFMFRSVLTWLSPSDQLPEQRDRGPAAEERGAEDQTEEARAGRVQRQRRHRRVRGTESYRKYEISIFSFLLLIKESN